MGSFVKASNKYLTSTVVSVTVQTIQGKLMKNENVYEKYIVFFSISAYIDKIKFSLRARKQRNIPMLKCFHLSHIDLKQHADVHEHIKNVFKRKIL
jgi:hypothetical protein